MEVVDNAQGVLTRKIGPLPAIAWGGILGGLYVGYRYWKVSREPATTTTGTAPVEVYDPIGSVGTASDFSDGYGNATGSSGTSTGAGASGSTTTASYVPPAAQTNVDWGKQAANYLIALGINPSTAQMAISAYLYGGTALNEEQSAALNQALRQLGTPPEGVLPTPEVTPIVAAPVVPTPVLTAPTPTPTPTVTNPEPRPAPVAKAVFTVPTYNGVEGASAADPYGWAYIKAAQDNPGGTKEDWYRSAVAARGNR